MQIQPFVKLLFPLTAITSNKLLLCVNKEKNITIITNCYKYLAYIFNSIFSGLSISISYFGDILYVVIKRYPFSSTTCFNLVLWLFGQDISGKIVQARYITAPLYIFDRLWSLVTRDEPMAYFQGEVHFNKRNLRYSSNIEIRYHLDEQNKWKAI